jgi:ornithine decarboxylase
MLPNNVREGDWIEIGQLGAYGSSLRTAFNGFDQAILAEVRDAAMLETSGYQAENDVTHADVAKLPFAYPRAA